MTIEELLDSLSIGGIYWFVNPKIRVPDPHPHVCVGVEGGKCILMLCGTSQFEKKRRYFELNKLPFETLVRIQANTTNTITKDTYVSCNDVQVHSIGELHANDTFAVKGKVNDGELLQIRNGIAISDLVEEEHKAIILKMIAE